MRPYFEWRGLGFISQSALSIKSELAAFDAERLFEIPGVRVTDPRGAQCGEVLKGVLKPPQCKLFGTECNPEHPVGALMVSSEGACAAYYRYTVACRRRRGLMTVIVQPTRKTPRFADVQIEMAHGAGGTASRRLVEGLIAPYFANPILQAFTDAAALSVDGRRVATTADGFVVKPLRFPGGSIGELAVNGTLNDLAVSARSRSR